MERFGNHFLASSQSLGTLDVYSGVLPTLSNKKNDFDGKKTSFHKHGGGKNTTQIHKDRFPNLKGSTIGAYTNIRAEVPKRRKNGPSSRKQPHTRSKYSSELNEIDAMGSSLKDIIENAKSFLAEREVSGNYDAEKKRFYSPIRKPNNRHVQLSTIERPRTRTEPVRYNGSDSDGSEDCRRSSEAEILGNTGLLPHDELPSPDYSSKGRHGAKRGGKKPALRVVHDDFSQLEITEEDLEKGQQILLKRHPWLFDSADFSARIPTLKAKLAVDDICTREMLQARAAMVELCRLQRAQELVMGELAPPSAESNGRGRRRRRRRGTQRGAKASIQDLQPEKMDRISRLHNSPFKLQQYAEVRREFISQCQAQENICMQAEEGLGRQAERYRAAGARRRDYGAYHEQASRWGALPAPTFNRTREPGKAYRLLAARAARGVQQWWWHVLPRRLQKKRSGAVALQKLIRGMLARKKWKPILKIRMKMGRVAYLRLAFMPWQRYWYTITKARLLLFHVTKRFEGECFKAWKRSFLETKQTRMNAVKRFLTDQAPMFDYWIAFTQQSKIDKNRAKAALYMQSRYRGWKARQHFSALLGLIHACKSYYVIRKAKDLKRQRFNQFIEEEITKYLQRRVDAQLAEAVGEENARINKLQGYYRNLGHNTSPEISLYLRSKEGKKAVALAQKQIQLKAKLANTKLGRGEAKKKAVATVQHQKVRSIQLSARHDFWARASSHTNPDTKTDPKTKHSNKKKIKTKGNSAMEDTSDLHKRSPFFCIRPGCDRTFVCERHYLQHEAEQHPEGAPAAALHALLLGGTAGADSLAGSTLDPEGARLFGQYVDRSFGLDSNMWLLQLFQKLQEWRCYTTGSAEFQECAVDINESYFKEFCLRPVENVINIRLPWPTGLDEKVAPQIFDGVEYSSLCILQKNALPGFLNSDLWKEYVKSKSTKVNRIRKDVRGTVIRDTRARTKEWAIKFKTEVIEHEVWLENVDKKATEVVQIVEHDLIDCTLDEAIKTVELADIATETFETFFLEECFWALCAPIIQQEQIKQKRIDDEYNANIDSRTEALLWKLEKSITEWLIHEQALAVVASKHAEEDAINSTLEVVSEEMIFAALSHIIRQHTKQKYEALGKTDALDHEMSQKSTADHEVHSGLPTLKSDDQNILSSQVQHNSAVAAQAVLVVKDEARVEDRPIIRFKAITKSRKDLLESKYSEKHTKLDPSTAVLRIQMAFRRYTALKRVKHMVSSTYSKQYDPQSGSYYYLNNSTGVSSWSRPKLLKRLYPNSKF